MRRKQLKDQAAAASRPASSNDSTADECKLSGQGFGRAVVAGSHPGVWLALAPMLLLPLPPAVAKTDTADPAPSVAHSGTRPVSLQVSNSRDRIPVGEFAVFRRSGRPKANEPVAFLQRTREPASDSSTDENPGPTALSGEEKLIDLLAKPLASQWVSYSSKDQVDSPVWSRIPEEGSEETFILKCSGSPKGYLRTISEYQNFELTLEWMYPGEGIGNSGILICTKSEPRIWPTSLQVQLHQPKAGSLLVMGDATAKNAVDVDSELESNRWHTCRISCRNGEVAVEINGRSVGQVTGVTPSAGFIALQSEGSEIYFRRIRLRPLSPAETDGEVPPAAETQTVEAVPTPPADP